MEWIISHWDQIVTVVLMVAGWLLARPWAKSKIAQAEAFGKETQLNLAWNLAVSVAQRVYQDCVRDLRANGKWDDEAKRRVLSNAVDIMKSEAKEHGLEIAQAILPGLIQRAVMFLKKEGQGAVVPFSIAAPEISASVPPPELGNSIPGLP